ncbi:hypothetical protein Q8G38_00315 [Halomonas venusta]|uniref:hypothetical protein n=1 Tax=Vreelandella venusta TaxID=44935 RepID=UPI00295E3CC8|nr:hypothetical protein [Halomonas venusta]MDW0357752.1 hypothetical protein [Halomonas venusta]
MSKEIPYQLSVNQLEDALDHVMRLAKASRSQTKRLKVIAARAEAALNGEVYDGKDLKLPEPARAPMSYENEIRVTKRELMAALERERALTAHLEELKREIPKTQRQYRHNNDNSPSLHNPDGGFVFGYCTKEVDRLLALKIDTTCLARMKDKAQYDLIDGLLLNHTQFIPESAGPIVELLLQIQEGLRPQAESAKQAESAVA